MRFWARPFFLGQTAGGHPETRGFHVPALLLSCPRASWIPGSLSTLNAVVPPQRPQPFLGMFGGLWRVRGSLVA